MKERGSVENYEPSLRTSCTPVCTDPEKISILGCPSLSFPCDIHSRHFNHIRSMGWVTRTTCQISFCIALILFRGGLGHRDKMFADCHPSTLFSSTPVSPSCSRQKEIQSATCYLTHIYLCECNRDSRRGRRTAWKATLWDLAVAFQNAIKFHICSHSDYCSDSWNSIGILSRKRGS